MTRFRKAGWIGLALLVALLGEGGLPPAVSAQSPHRGAEPNVGQGNPISSQEGGADFVRSLEGDGHLPRQTTDRPEWVEARPRRVNGEYRLSVQVGPYASLSECHRHLPGAVEQAIDEYVAILVGPAARGKVKLPWSYVERQIIRERFEESRVFRLTSTQQATMHSLHVLLGFDQEANQYIRQLWRTAEGFVRLARIGVLFAIAVWSMAVIWGYLRLDLMSRGQFRRSLRGAMLILLALPWVLLGFLTLR